MSAENLIVTLGWDMEQFWKDVEEADVSTLEAALKILDAPDPEGWEEYQKLRCRSGQRSIREELVRRKDAGDASITE